MREPLPIYCKTSAAWAQAAPKNRERLARKQWTSEWDFPKEDKDAEHQAVLGGIVPFERLLDEPPRDDENGDGWDARRREPVRSLRPTPVGGSARPRAGDRPMTAIPSQRSGSPRGPHTLRHLRTSPDAASRSWRRVPAPARRSRSPRSSPATSPKERHSTGCSSITFTRMATGELRERVRERLVKAAEGLSDALAGVPVDPERRRPACAGRCSPGRDRAPSRPTGQGHRRFRCRHDRDHTRVLPPRARRSRCRWGRRA